MNIDFNKLAKDIYASERAHKYARIEPTDPSLSTYSTISNLQRALGQKLSYTHMDKCWNAWWDDWYDTRLKFIERFGSIHPDIEIVILEKTLKEHWSVWFK